MLFYFLSPSAALYKQEKNQIASILGIEPTAIIELNEKFAYLNILKTSHSETVIIFSHKIFFLATELCLIEHQLSHGQIQFILFEEPNEIAGMIERVMAAPTSDDSQTIEIPKELWTLSSLWNHLTYYKTANLIDGFIHNISTPITALCGRVELARMTHRNLADDPKFTFVIENLTNMVKNFQWYQENIETPDYQKIYVTQMLNNLIETLGCNLTFKHRVQLEISTESESCTLNTIPKYFIFLVFSMIENISDYVHAENTSIKLQINTRMTSDYMLMTFSFPNIMECNFEQIDIVEPDHQKRFGLSLAYLKWHYIVPEQITLISMVEENQRLIEIGFPLNHRYGL